MRSKLLSLALALAMCLGLAVPASAHDISKAGQVSSVSAGNSHTGLIDTNGSLWMWGENRFGQLGNGYVGNKEFDDGHGAIPIQTVPIKLMDSVANVSCGAYQTFIVKTDGFIMWSQR